jgi:hypothetical protein
MEINFGAFQHTTSKYAFGGHLQVIVSHSAVTTVSSRVHKGTMGDPADTIAKLICCPMFDGQVDNFLTWYMRFEIFTYNNGFEKAIVQLPWIHRCQQDKICRSWLIKG